MSSGSTTSWSLPARWFHWGTLLLLAVQIPLGFWMVEVYEAYTETWADDTWVMRTSMWHHTIGFIVLSITALRFSWRLSQPVPQPLTALALYQRWLARFTHLFLYVLLFIYPLSGWASLSAYEGEFPIFLFAWDSVPRLVPQVTEEAFFNYEFFAEVHRWCWKIGAGVLGLHIGGALWHHFIVRDGILRRMCQGRVD